MKKVLLILLVILLFALSYYTVFQGWSFGNLTVLSFSQIKEKNSKLEEQIDLTERLADVDYKILIN